VTELALDDVDRDPFAGELDGVGVSELVRREAAPEPGRGREVAQFAAGGGRGPASSAVCPSMTQNRARAAVAPDGLARRRAT
jgi:hypothetical protein